MSSLIIFIILFLILSAFFSGSEIAFISANKLSVEVEKDKGSRKGKILARFYDRPKDFLGTMLVGNNIALVVFTTLMTRLLKPYLEPSLGDGYGFLLISTVLITIVVLIFGEFLPKVMSRLFANEMMSSMIYPLAFFKWLLRAPTWLMTKLSNVILKYILRTSIDKAEDAITRLDLQDFVEGTVSPEHDEIETDMFKNALHLKNVRIEDCMVPRTEIAYVDISSSVKELADAFIETRHSRLIVTNGDVDHVLGYVHHQELLSNPKSVKKAMREITFVPETMSAKDLMIRMIYDEYNIACVVDEFGGTAGIITLEDILEEIFGEIEDEHDEEDYVEEQLSETEFLFSGRLEVSYLNEKYEQIEIPEGDYNTLSGYIVMTSGDIPEQGAEIQMGGYRFIFESVSEKKIETIRVVVLPEDR
ncbi:MAG: hemolysin family protein [Saprospiraceae bacterium]|nr:hemolysin family protein [Saprospiraceae bacterium]